MHSPSLITSSSLSSPSTTSTSFNTQKSIYGSKDTNVQQQPLSANYTTHHQQYPIHYRSQATTQSLHSSPIQTRHRTLNHYHPNLNAYKSSSSSIPTNSSNTITTTPALNTIAGSNSPSLTIKLNNNNNNNNTITTATATSTTTTSTTTSNIKNIIDNIESSNKKPTKTQTQLTSSTTNSLRIPLTNNTNPKNPFISHSATNFKYNPLPISTNKVNLNLNRSSSNKVLPSKLSNNSLNEYIKQPTSPTKKNKNSRMKIIPSPTIRIADLFRCFLKNVPKNTETIEGPALCVTYDAVLKDEHWEEIFVCSEDDKSNTTTPISPKQTSQTPNSKSPSYTSSLSNQTLKQQNATKFISFFHISDFIAILSGYKVAFVDPHERLSSPDERSYVAIFDLEKDTEDIEQFEDQFKPLEKIFNIPLLRNRYYNGTIIRLPLRTQSNTCNVSSKLIYVKDIIQNAKDFMKEAHLHILFSKNISSIQFCRTKDGQNIEKIYSINVEDANLELFKQKNKKVNECISNGEFPSTSTIIITIRKQIEAKVECVEWILSIFADTMRLLNSNHFLMKIAIPTTDNYDKDMRFSYKSNLISSDTGFIKTLYLTKPIICYIEDKEGILMSHFCRLNINDSLKLSHFNDAYALMLKDLTYITRRDPKLLWSLMPNIEKHPEFSELLAEIWIEIAKHQLFYSRTEGWGYVGIEDMIINNIEDTSPLQSVLTFIYSSSNYPVVIMPDHAFKALQKYAPKDGIQVMTPSQTSDILHNNVNLIEQLKYTEKILLLEYLLKEQQTRYIVDLPLLLLANNKFIRFQTQLNSKTQVKDVYLVDKKYMKLFLNSKNSDLNSQNLQLFVNPDLSENVLQVLRLPEFQKATQVKMVTDSEFIDLINIPKEWKNGDEKLQWPLIIATGTNKTSTDLTSQYNLEWLETLWKYLNETNNTDLNMIENLNVIYTLPTTTTAQTTTSNKLILYKLSKNSNLVYTPPYNHQHTPYIVGTSTTINPSTNSNNDDSHTIDEHLISDIKDLNETTYNSLIKILIKLGFTCIDTLPQLILKNKLFFNYVPNIKKKRLNLLKAFRNKYKHASLDRITQEFNSLLNNYEIKLLREYLSKIEINYVNIQQTQGTNSTTSSSSASSNGYNGTTYQRPFISAQLYSSPTFSTQRTYNSTTSTSNNDDEQQQLLDIMKELALFENSALECSDRYLPLKEIKFIYESNIHLPFELPNINPFICVQDIETRYLIETILQMNIIKDFKVILREILKYCLNKELNTLKDYKMHCLGKWLLLNSSNFIFNKQTTNDNDLIELIKTTKLFLNQKQELCSLTQFLNPIYKAEKYLELIDLKYLPAKDLIQDEKCIQIICNEFKLRTILQLNVDEIIDLFEHSIKQPDAYRRTVAQFVIDNLLYKYQQIVQQQPQQNETNEINIEKYLNEYSTLKAVTLRHFLQSVEWVSLKRDRPQSYPQSLIWKDSEQVTSSNSKTNTTSTRIRFSSPRDCIPTQYAYCVGSIAYICDIDIPRELKEFIDLKSIQLDLVVRHLKVTTKCFETASKAEWYDYLTVLKHCYEHMNTYDMQDIYRELKAHDLNEWIWNGTGFSSITTIFLITDKDHPLCAHVATLPYELYEYVKFFERLGVKKEPDIKQLEEILLKCIKLPTSPVITAKQTNIKTSQSPTLPQQQQQNQQGPLTTSEQSMLLEIAAKNYPLLNWIKQKYQEKKLLNLIREYEENLVKLIGTTAATPFISTNGTTSNQLKSPINTFTFPQEILNDNPDHIYLYLPELYKGLEIKESLINSVKHIAKNRQVVILDEEAYLARKIAASSMLNSTPNTANMNGTNGIANNNNNNNNINSNNNIYDHYRVYNEIILPNLHSLSKQLRDQIVLFALDHADPKMLEILRDHPCIPAQIGGRFISRKPNKLVHPHGKLAPLYSDSDGCFPYGTEETYLRDDRLQILKILGMKCDQLNWIELVERADSISKLRDYDLALERSIVVLQILNEMLNNSTSGTNFNNLNEQKDEKDSKQKACEQLREIAFIPVKPKPYQKLNLVWYGDKYRHRFAKPKEVLSSAYEFICSCTWPIPLNEYKKKEFLITKQIEQFLGFDDLSSKYTIKDALKQLDEATRLHLNEIDDQKELKYVSDICMEVYEYLQRECQKNPNENTQIVRDFFVDHRCILLNEEFIGVHQLCYELNVNLRSLFYQIPASFLRSFKYLFSNVLNIKVHLDLTDLLDIVESIKKKYKDNPINSKEDFNILMNVYALIIDQGYSSISLYLPNVNSVLHLGNTLYFYNESLDKPEEYVHPAVDRRVCVIAGAMMKKQPQITSLQSSSPSLGLIDTTQSTIVQQPTSRMFPRVFGNKRLEGILARLDDEHINVQYINNMDEGNPQVILDYILEANRVHSYISAYLSDDDIYVLLKYFNDFLARNYPNSVIFHKLKELKIFKPLWSDKYLHLNFNVQTPTTPKLDSTVQSANIYLISEEMATLMKRSFKHNPFNFNITPATPSTPKSASSTATLTPTPTLSSHFDYSAASLFTNQPFIILIRRNELLKLYSHLNFLSLNDLEAFLHICLPQFRKLDAKSQANFLKYLYDDILEKCYTHDKEKCFKILREKLFIQTRKNEQQLISDLYDWKNDALKSILNDSYFPDEMFDSPQCLRFLKEAGLRTFLPSDLCKRCMNDIETKVSNDGWNEDLRTRSRLLYQHLIDNWQRFDDSVLQQRFLEPHCPDKRYLRLSIPFEYQEFKKTCIKLSDAELFKYEKLVWSSSYILPSFVNCDLLDMGAIEFLKLNRQPCFALVNQHLTNVCETIGKIGSPFTNTSSSGANNSSNQAIDNDFEETLIEVLKKCYQYLDDLNRNEHNKDIYKQLEEKEIVWSQTTKRFVTPNRICIDLDVEDEIPPFLYSLPQSLIEYKQLFLRLGSREKPFAMLYGDILRKMAKVCGDDYLNSNELCKALKSMECFFKYLSKSTNANTPHDSSNSSNSNTNEPLSSQYKLAGLYLVTTDLKLEKSCNVVIIDNRSDLDYIPKLPQEKFLFNPSERVLKMNTNEIKPILDKIFISQRPSLFTQKYEETYDFSVPDDPNSQRQILLTSLERKYQQIFTSRQLHRSLARCIINEEARRSSPKHLPIDEVEKVIRERLSGIKVVCVEYLETSLNYRRLSSQQQKIDQTVEEKACYLTNESSNIEMNTCYLSKKHIEQPYFPLCLARSLQPLFIDLHVDYSILTALIATNVAQMVKVLQLVNVASEENILSVIKLQYVPSSGKIYGDDISLLAPFDPKVHNVLPGDLCVYLTNEVYVYVQVIKVLISPKSSTTNKSNGTNSTQDKLEYTFLVQIDENGQQKINITDKELYVLENWHRVYDALISKPPDERESFKYQDSTSNGTFGGNNGGTGSGGYGSSASSEGRRTPGDGEENFSDSSDKSETSSMYDSNDNLAGVNQTELEQAKNEVNQELRTLWSLEENERKKKINRLLLKWHPDKNPGREKFASEVFKHLKKQIEFYKTDPFLASFYRSTSYASYGSNSYGGYNGTTGNSGTGSTGTSDDYKSKHYGSFDDLHRKNSSAGTAGGTSSSTYSESTGADARGDSPNLGRSGSFRQDWERRRQQKRTGTDPREQFRRYRSYSRDDYMGSERGSPSSRRRGTDFAHMDASLWFTQAKADLDSADNDMHPMAGKPAYEWVCYKCYRSVEKALRAYHYYKGNGKLPASDIHGLLLGVETNIRDIAFRFCNFIGNEANAMQYPGISRFGKIPNEVFPLTKAEQAMDYAKELLKLVEEIIYAT